MEQIFCKKCKTVSQDKDQCPNCEDKDSLENIKDIENKFSEASE